MNLDSVEAAKNMVQLGLGISFLPSNGVRRELDSGSLSLIALAETPAVLLPTYVLLRRGQQHDPAVVAFLKLLQETYAMAIPNQPTNRYKSGIATPFGSHIRSRKSPASAQFQVHPPWQILQIGR